MAWIWLTLAGLLEVVWAIGLKYTDGLSRLWPIGTGCAVWTGIGAAGVAILGILLFNESRELLRIGSILLIVAGIAGLKLVST